MVATTFLILTIISKTCIIALSTNTSSPKLFPAILIFGDSTVDTGNNNYLINALFKGNHYPYGKDFPGHVPTGRFSNGKLVPDFIASMLKIKDIVPPFLKPNLSDEELLTGVSFASAGSGYDDLTSVASGVIPCSKQVDDYFKKYIERIQGIVGEKEAKKIVKRALVLVSAGTNDFGFNFYDTPTRRLEFDIDGYQDFLQKNLKKYIEELYELGCRKIVVTGLPPIGCLPIQMTVKFENPSDRKCLEDENLDSQTYNYKLSKLLARLQALLPGSKLVYADTYGPLIDMINRPQKYGFVETKRGCCGTGLLEAGPFCNSFTPPCDEVSKYLFWDIVHPSEAAYQFLSIYLEKEVLPKLLQ